jgi:CheY-like chemotaxis protein
VRQIMSFSRKTPATRIPVQISTIIQESLKLMRATIPTNIEVNQEILCSDEMILANPTEINQILLNLCSNAVHAMGDETGLLQVRLEKADLDYRNAARYEDLTPGKYVKLTVEDNGSGIDSTIMASIFDPYFTTKDVDKGLGMGLAVVYGIVKKHDGAIHFKSQFGVGTTAEVLFPITEDLPEKGSQIRADLPMGTETILLVDDEPSLVKMVSQILEKQGYSVVGKTSSTDALKAFKQKPDHFDLVISDMAMPEMPGDLLVVELLKIRPNVPIILCTGHSDRIDEKRAKALGVADYSMKPYEKKELVRKVRKVLDEAKTENQV